MPPLIEVKSLSKYFKVPAGVLHAVDNVSFTIEKGKTLGVVGESGCGKSTLGRTIIRLQEATDGLILLNGEDITHVRGKALKEVRKRVQIVFQDPYSSLNPRLRIEDTIREPLKNSGKYSRWTGLVLTRVFVSCIPMSWMAAGVSGSVLLVLWQ
jgi:peptide/nickel transport system ATP-binding protein